MFSLIITITSIALVAALALATLFYGGNAFNRGAAEANAAKLVLQSQQIRAAMELYQLDNNNGSFPVNMQTLVAGGYLTSIPVAQLQEKPSLISSAFADNRQWRIPVPGVPAYILDTGIDADTCAAFNARTTGYRGILRTAIPGANEQCFGPAPEALRIYAGLRFDAPTMTSVLGASLVASSGVIPASASDPAWLRPPHTPPVSGAPDAPPSGGGTPPAADPTSFLDVRIQHFSSGWVRNDITFYGPLYPYSPDFDEPWLLTTDWTCSTGGTYLFNGAIQVKYG